MDIKIYRREHCSQCQAVIEYFHKKQVDFEEIDVTYDSQKFEEMFRLGGIATPLIVIGKHVIHSFDPKKMEKAMEESL